MEVVWVVEVMQVVEAVWVVEVVWEMEGRVGGDHLFPRRHLGTKLNDGDAQQHRERSRRGAVENSADDARIPLAA